MKANSLEHFARTLRRLREEAGYSMDTFCEKFNKKYKASLNKSTISRYENMAQEPMLSTAKNIADFFGISPTELLGYNNNKKPHKYTISNKDMLLLENIKKLSDKDKRIIEFMISENKLNNKKTSKKS